jgi:hypothetical protein
LRGCPGCLLIAVAQRIGSPRRLQRTPTGGASLSLLLCSKASRRRSKSSMMSACPSATRSSCAIRAAESSESSSTGCAAGLP